MASDADPHLSSIDDIWSMASIFGHRVVGLNMCCIVEALQRSNCHLYSRRRIQARFIFIHGSLFIPLIMDSVGCCRA